ncbi:protein CLN8-like [Chelonoidis abingdonii]|uniref:TLC domain-containing protein n=1 Tax=Chelonoidis abingdonii TaxID=106734 RepID=A0A8C0J3U1_CHEAB|nr:protein CLN8-like [Chelonoidis abingdonii]XP_032654137.1 protein CLN8-like [Chelonoidis abingdonii]XP_032654138.1 protein CLN8-like [Chelonoidis abingdonii]
MNLANDGAMFSAIYDWDYVLWEVRLKLVAAGFFIYLGVFLLAHWLSSWISASYCTLSAKQKIFWNMDITRGLFAVQSCGAGLWALLIDPVFQADQVYAQKKWSWFHCLIATGYFLFENVVFHVSNIVFRIFDVFLVVHHLFAFGGLLGLIINIKSGHYLPLMGLLLEMNNPSYCISCILARIGYAHTLFWKANQWVLIHMQHCRMVLSYHMWWVCISHWNDVVENLGLPYFIVFFMGLSTLTLILNPYWIFKATQRLFGPVDRKFPNTAVKNASCENLNSDTFQKKRI